MDIANARYSYTGQCICNEGYKACYERVDYTTFDNSKCGPFCPSSRLIVCVEPDAPCPGEEPTSGPGEEEGAESVGSSTGGEEPAPRSTVPDLVRDLEEFLAGQGVKGPTPSQAAAGGAATATLIAAWVLSNLLSGANIEDLLRAVSEWWRGGGEPGARQTQPDAGPSTLAKAPPTTPPERTSPGARTQPPASESLEDRARRHGLDARDGLQALDKTLDDAKKFKDRVMRNLPDRLKTDAHKRASDALEKTVDKIRKTTKLDQAKRVVDGVNSYMKDWERVDENLKGRRVSKQAKDAVKVLTSAGRAATEIPMQMSDRVHDVAAQAAERALKPFSEKAAKRAKEAILEQKKALHRLREEMVHLPSKAVRSATKGPFGEYWRDAEKNNPELRGIKGPGAFPPPKGFDPRVGLRKAEGWIERVRQWLVDHGIWQLRRVPRLEDD